jgi:hypothetical protein
MAIVTINDEHLVNIAGAIRGKNGTENTYKPSEMAEAISAIETGGGSSGIAFRTADEIYAEERPSDWPVLPDPIAGNKETYFLCKTTTIGKVNVHDGSVGYINENGEYVVVANTTGIYNGTFGYWRELDISSSWDSRMDKYYVYKSNTSDHTAESASPSSTFGTGCNQVLEIKTSLPDAAFNRIKNSSDKYYQYQSIFKKLRFISFYGPQDWKSAKYKFSGYKSLLCIRFDSDENNAFLRANTTITSAEEMFRDCYSYEAEIHITPAWSALTEITYMVRGCKHLSKLVLDCPYVTTCSYVVGDPGDSVKELYVNLPSVTSSNTYLVSSNSNIEKITRFNMSGITSSSQYLTGYGISYAREIYNLLINKSSQSSWTLPVQYNVERYTFDPEQTAANLPTKLQIQYTSMPRASWIEFFNSLPDATGLGKTIYFTTGTTFGDGDYMDDDLLEILTGKGYTVTL